jgi:hypothetical protein
MFGPHAKPAVARSLVTIATRLPFKWSTSHEEPTILPVSVNASYLPKTLCISIAAA